MNENTQGDYCDHYFALPLEDLPGYFGDAFDLDLQFKRVEGGIEVYENRSNFGLNDRWYKIAAFYGVDEDCYRQIFRLFNWKRLVFWIRGQVQNMPKPVPGWRQITGLYFVYNNDVVDQWLGVVRDGQTISPAPQPKEDDN